jgi:hypothetical protein
MLTWKEHRQHVVVHILRSLIDVRIAPSSSKSHARHHRKMFRPQYQFPSPPAIVARVEGVEIFH